VLRNLLAPLLGDGLFTAEGEHWLRQRRLMQPVFHHKRIDAFGFALENFDGVGRWRELDELGKPVDATSELRGHKLTGAADLKALLRDKRHDFARCLTEKMLTYALGRGVDYYDQPTIDRIQRTLAGGGYKFSTLITAIVKSAPFTMRRGASQLAALDP